jgi:hypothetical protein
VIIDPQIAIIRIARQPGADFYDAVMTRVAARAEQPRGVLLHFSAPRADEFILGTVFRDHETMAEGFLRYTATEAQNEMLERGEAVDITRDQFQLERLFVQADVTPESFSLQPVEGVAAMTSDHVSLDLAKYHALADEIGNYKQPVAGRLAHVAYSDKDGMVRLFEFWSSREIGQAWYDEHANSVFERMNPGQLTTEVRDASWLDVHSFLVTPDADDLSRDFVRRASGPSSV